MKVQHIPYQFRCDRDGMIGAIRRASNPNVWNGWSEATGMTAVEEAVWFAKYVVRKARHLGLYDDSAERMAA
jgi:hypothetical protein